MGEGPDHRDPVCTPCTRFWFPATTTKRNPAPWKWQFVELGELKLKDIPGIPCGARQYGIAQIMMEARQKDTGQLLEPPQV